MLHTGQLLRCPTGPPLSAPNLRGRPALGSGRGAAATADVLREVNEYLLADGSTRMLKAPGQPSASPVIMHHGGFQASKHCGCRRLIPCEPTRAGPPNDSALRLKAGVAVYALMRALRRPNCLPVLVAAPSQRCRRRSLQTSTRRRPTIDAGSNYTPAPKLDPHIPSITAGSRRMGARMSTAAAGLRGESLRLHNHMLLSIPFR